MYGISKRNNYITLYDVGGTIGLFTGLSLISLVEAIYWIYRTVLAILTNVWSYPKTSLRV